MVQKFKIVILQEFHPPPMSHVQLLLIKQILETLVIAEYPKLGTTDSAFRSSRRTL